MQFTDGDTYSFTNWTIPIPNTKSSSYTTYKNAYDLALTQREQRIATAQNALELAQKTQEKEVATPRSTSLAQASASIKSAQARIAQIDAQIADLSIVAPFDGIVTSVDIQPGETGTTKPVITLLTQDTFELKARVPEIDITKITPGQQALVYFDADANTALSGTVSFVSPLATNIDGVAYFQTTILLEETPKWICSGLNADIDITVDSYTDVLFIPKRYLITTDTTSYVLLHSQTGEPIKTSVEVIATTNDGNVAITGVTEGDIVIAP